MNVKEQSTLLGKVQEIQRIADVDYLVVQTDASLIEKKLSKSFYIPFIERYILDVDKALEEVHVKDALALLENS